MGNLGAFWVIVKDTESGIYKLFDTCANIHHNRRATSNVMGVDTMINADTFYEQSHAKVDSAGRVLIPSTWRRRLNIAEGEEVLIEADDGGIRITTAQQALKNAQAFFAGLAKPGESVVDELIRERREAAARE